MRRPHCSLCYSEFVAMAAKAGMTFRALVLCVLASLAAAIIGALMVTQYQERERYQRALKERERHQEALKRYQEERERQIKRDQKALDNFKF
jgi:hypothetical protein